MTPIPQRQRLNGYDLAWLEAGAAHGGRPLLLVHGSLCDARYWAPQMQPLGARRRVIAVSLRHYWPEAWDGGGTGFSIAQHAADLAALVRALGAGPVDCLGHSRGGSVAWELARQAPELLHSLVLAEPGLCVAGSCGQDQLDRGNFRESALALLRRQRVDEALQLFIDTVSGPGTWTRMLPALRGMMRDNANTLIGQVAEGYATVTPADAARLRLPLLLIGGARSPEPYPSVLAGLARLLPGAQRVTIPAASHAVNLWNPAAFNQALEQFLGTLP